MIQNLILVPPFEKISFYLYLEKTLPISILIIVEEDDSLFLMKFIIFSSFQRIKLAIKRHLIKDIYLHSM